MPFFVVARNNIVSANTTTSFGTLQSKPTLSVHPSTLIIKVGDSAKVNLTLANASAGLRRVCFGVRDFPSSGFITSVDPACTTSQSDLAVSTLTVEATPAAAPQSFIASVVASNGNWTQTVPINITVEPAMPAWIPWSIILVFILIFVIPLTVKAKKTQHPRRK